MSNQDNRMSDDTDIQLIETMKVDPGPSMPVRAWRRRLLQASCDALCYRWPGETLFSDLGRIAAALDPNAHHRIRLLLAKHGEYTLTPGPLPPTPEPVLIYLDPRPLQAERLWLLHKTTNRPWYGQTQEWLAAHPNVFDVVFCNDKDEVCEGSRVNLYMLDQHGKWLTPPLDCGLLPGVMRQHLLDRGLVTEARITRDQFLAARAIRVSNALRGWLDARLPHES